MSQVVSLSDFRRSKERAGQPAKPKRLAQPYRFVTQQTLDNAVRFLRGFLTTPRYQDEIIGIAAQRDITKDDLFAAARVLCAPDAEEPHFYRYQTGYRWIWGFAPAETKRPRAGKKPR